MFFNFNLKTVKGEISFRIRDEKTVIFTADNERIAEIKDSIVEIDYHPVSNTVHLINRKKDINGHFVGYYIFDVEKMKVDSVFFRQAVVRYKDGKAI